MTVYLIAATGALVALLTSVIAVCLWKRNLKLRRQMRDITAKGRDATISDVEAEAGMITSIPNNTSNMLTTLMATTHEISIPGYLLSEYITHFVPGREIARGGQGSICHCEIKEGALKDRTKG